MSKPLTFADVSMLAMATKIIQDRGVYGIYITGGRTELQVDCEAIVSAAKDTPVPLTVKPHGNGGLWHVSISYGGATLFTLLERSDLHLAGYQVTAPPPVVPLVAEAATA